MRFAREQREEGGETMRKKGQEQRGLWRGYRQRRDKRSGESAAANVLLCCRWTLGDGR